MRKRKKKKGILNKLLFGWQVLKKFNDDNGFLMSSGLSFNFLVSLIPLSLLLLAFAGAYLYSDREVLNHIRNYLESLFPSLDPRIMENLLRVIHDRKIVGIVGIGGLVWSALWVFTSLRTAMDIIFQAKKGKRIIRGIAVDFLMILLIGSLQLANMTLTSLMTYLQHYHFGFKPLLGLGILAGFTLKYLLPLFFSFWMVFLIYQIIPHREIRFKTALSAALFTSLLWEVAKQFFGWYVLNLSRYTVIYGSLSTLAIFVLWVYFSSAILLLGGEVAFMLDKRRNS